jgi:hypothetical protein
MDNSMNGNIEDVETAQQPLLPQASLRRRSGSSVDGCNSTAPLTNEEAAKVIAETTPPTSVAAFQRYGRSVWRDAHTSEPGIAERAQHSTAQHSTAQRSTHR